MPHLKGNASHNVTLRQDYGTHNHLIWVRVPPLSQAGAIKPMLAIELNELQIVFT